MGERALRKLAYGVIVDRLKYGGAVVHTRITPKGLLEVEAVAPRNHVGAPMRMVGFVIARPVDEHRSPKCTRPMDRVDLLIADPQGFTDLRVFKLLGRDSVLGDEIIEEDDETEERPEGEEAAPGGRSWVTIIQNTPEQWDYGEPVAHRR